MTKAQIDEIVYRCRQNGNDTTYDIVNTAIRAALAHARQAATTASADNAEFLSTLQGAAKEATDEWIAGFVRQHFGVYAATTASADKDKEA